MALAPAGVVSEEGSGWRSRGLAVRGQRLQQVLSSWTLVRLSSVMGLDTWP